MDDALTPAEKEFWDKFDAAYRAADGHPSAGKISKIANEISQSNVATSTICGWINHKHLPRDDDEFTRVLEVLQAEKLHNWPQLLHAARKGRDARLSTLPGPLQFSETQLQGQRPSSEPEVRPSAPPDAAIDADWQPSTSDRGVNTARPLPNRESSAQERELASTPEENQTPDPPDLSALDNLPQLQTEELRSIAPVGEKQRGVVLTIVGIIVVSAVVVVIVVWCAFTGIGPIDSPMAVRGSHPWPTSSASGSSRLAEKTCADVAVPFTHVFRGPGAGPNKKIAKYKGQQVVLYPDVPDATGPDGRRYRAIQSPARAEPGRFPYSWMLADDITNASCDPPRQGSR